VLEPSVVVAQGRRGPSDLYIQDSDGAHPGAQVGCPRRRSGATTHEEVLCVWTPERWPVAAYARPGPDGVGPWQLMRRRFPEQENLTHCAWPPATGGGAAVEFGFIGIPPG
jgi:hypothetical protein